MLYRWIHPQFLRKCIASFCFSMKPGTCVRLWCIGPWNYLCLVRFPGLGFRAKPIFHCKSASPQMAVIPIAAAHRGTASFTPIKNCPVLFKAWRATYFHDTKKLRNRDPSATWSLWVYICIYFHPYMLLKMSHFEQTNFSSIECYVTHSGGWYGVEN